MDNVSTKCILYASQFTAVYVAILTLLSWEMFNMIQIKVPYIYIIIIVVQGAIEKFIEYLQGHRDMKMIGCMLNTVDKSIANKYQESSDRDHESRGYSSKELKEMECLQAENQALKAQLMSQLEDVEKENDDLKRALDKMKSCQSSHDEQVGMLLKEIQELKSRLEAEMATIIPGQTCSARTPSTPVNCRIKVFSSLPKSLRDFYDQMENGTEELQ